MPGAVRRNLPLLFTHLHPCRAAETLFAGRAVHPGNHTFSFTFLNKIDSLAPPALPGGGGVGAPGQRGAAACSAGTSIRRASEAGPLPPPSESSGPPPHGSHGRADPRFPREKREQETFGRFGFLSPCTELMTLLSLCKRQEDGAGWTSSHVTPSPDACSGLDRPQASRLHTPGLS